MQNAIFRPLVDAEEMSRLYSKDQHVLYDRIKHSLAYKLEKLSHKDLLTLIHSKDGMVQEVLQPKADKKYAKALLAFLANKKTDGFSIDSFVTPLITKAVEDEFILFYSDAGRMEEVLFTTEKKLSEIRDQIHLHEGSSTSVDMQKLVELHGSSLQANGLVQSALEEFSADALAEAIKKVVALLEKASYKAVMVNMGKAVFSSGIASFIKPIVLAVLAKVGIAAIAKAAIAKALSVIIGVGAIAASVPAAYVLLPAVLAFLSYEAFTLPKKLAAKLPKEITSKLEADFSEINTAITAEMTRSLLQELDNWIME